MNNMQAQTLQEFAAHYAVNAHAHAAAFEVISDKFLCVNLGSRTLGSDGTPLMQVWTKRGSMVAYTGGLKFEREGTFEHGLKHAMKKAFTEEGATLVRASCTDPGMPAQLFLADEGKSVALLRLMGDAVVVNGNDLLAFEPSIKHKITMMRKISSIAAGGLFNVQLQGNGFVAILTHGKPVTLPVSADMPPVFTDAEATVAWSGNLTCDFHTDVSFKTFFGRSSGESFQMKFVAPQGGHGFVIVQPFEEHPPPPPSSSSSGAGSIGVDLISGIASGLSG